MKIRNTIFLLAACYVSAAHAQSSLTLYGIIDEFAQYVDTGHGYTAAMGSSGQWASRFGLKGTEDIGGGNAVNFVLENGFAPTTGALATPGSLFNRQAWVGMSGAWGQVRMGRQNSPLFIDEGRMDAFGAVAQASGLDNITTYGIRTSNTVSYLSPSWNGLKGGVYVGLGDAGGLRGTGASYQFDVTYDHGPVSAFVAGQALRNTEGAPTDRTILSGVSYAIGKFTVYGAYTWAKWDELALDANTYGLSVGYTLAGAANAGLPLAYPGADARGIQLGVVHRF